MPTCEEEGRERREARKKESLGAQRVGAGSAQNFSSDLLPRPNRNVARVPGYREDLLYFRQLYHISLNDLQHPASPPKTNISPMGEKRERCGSQRMEGSSKSRMMKCHILAPRKDHKGTLPNLDFSKWL